MILEADLRTGLSYLPPVPVPPDTADQAEATRAVVALRAALVARLRAEVRAAPDAAFTWLIHGLNNLPGLDAESGGSDQFLLCLQQLYLATVEHGPLVASRRPVGVFPPFWRQPVGYLLNLCATVSMALRESGIGAPILIRGGVLTVAGGGEGAWGAEVNLNADADAATGLDDFGDSVAVRRIEREAFQDSVTDLLDLFTGEREVLRRTRVESLGDVLLIDLDPGVDPVLRRMIGGCTLTLDRVRRHAFPSWKFAAGTPIERSVPAALTAATEADWFNYAPMLSACQGARGQVVPAAITSGYLLHRAATTAASTVSFRLHTAAQAAGREGPGPATRVRALVAEFHRDFERSIAGRIEAAGFTTVHGLEALRGRALPCGEIDVIGRSGDGAGPPVVVVAEVKNNDLAFAKDLAVRQKQALMGKARGQVLAKATWVAAHWTDVAPLLAAAGGTPPIVLALVVTRLLPLPYGEGGVAFLSAREIGPVVTALRTEPHHAWRADLRAAVVRSGGARWAG